MSNYSPDDQRTRDAVRELPRPDADPAYRARLREAFTSGAIDTVFGDSGTRPAPDPARFGARDGSGRVVRGPWLARPVARWTLAVAAAAAVAVAVIRLDRPAPWQVTGVQGEGIAVVDGRPIPMNHHAELAQALRPGARVVVPTGTELQITSPGNLVVVMTSGTDATVPTIPGRWFGRMARGEITTGQWRITTGARFRGARMMITTGEAAVEVVGTTLAVICEPHGTCVCVLDGTVKVGGPKGPRVAVEAGNRRFMFADGRDESDEMRPDERMKLDMLKESEAAQMWP